jgi:hypothetical protein
VSVPGSSDTPGKDGFRKRLRLTIEFAGFHTGGIAGNEFLSEEEAAEEAMQLADDTVAVVFAAHEGDSPGVFLKTLQGRIVGFGLSSMGFKDD